MASFAAGWININTLVGMDESGRVRDVLRVWADLACRPYCGGCDEPDQHALDDQAAWNALADADPTTSEDAVLVWAEEVLRHAKRCEHNPPKAGVRRLDDGLVLSWDGTWTTSRWVKIHLYERSEPGLSVRVEWDSGTGKPSRFLDLPGKLADGLDDDQFGETPRCSCGQASTTEIQVGWDASANSGAGGGQYEPACESCYVSSDEAERHRREHACLGLARPGYSD